MKAAVLLLILAGTASAAAPSAVPPSAVPPGTSWGYATVRPRAHMFWMLYRAPSPNLPLVLWLQGGPGGSSTGFGNYAEIGPLDTDLANRTHAWTQAANILFIDNPVGAGFSYVEPGGEFAKNNSAVASDLVAVLVSVLVQHPELRETPFYVFSESYGGKLTAGLGVSLLAAIAEKRITINFKGVALGDSWIDPVGYTQSWAPFLQGVSLMDAREVAAVGVVADTAAAAAAAGNGSAATAAWAATEDAISAASDGTNWYNFLQHNVADDAASATSALSALERRRDARLGLLHRGRNGDLSTLMNGAVRSALGGVIPDSVTWGGQAGAVFDQMAEDFMVPAIREVDALLAAGLPVAVYNGQLDLICDSPATEAWIAKLRWPARAAFEAAAKRPFYTASGAAARGTAGFLKAHAQLSLYLIMNAGHMVPADVPEAGLLLLRMITGQAPLPPS